MFSFLIGQYGMINHSLDGIIINILTGYSGNIELIAITAMLPVAKLIDVAMG